MAGQEDLERLVTLYFMNVFTNTSSVIPFGLHGSFPNLLEEDLEPFKAHVTNEDIRRALFSIGNYKALGVDGFQAIFYKSQWKVMGESFAN